MSREKIGTAPATPTPEEEDPRLVEEEQHAQEQAHQQAVRQLPPIVAPTPQPIPGVPIQGPGMTAPGPLPRRNGAEGPWAEPGPGVLRPKGLLPDEPAPVFGGVRDIGLTDVEKQRLVDDMYGGKTKGRGTLGGTPDNPQALTGDDWVVYRTEDGRDVRVKVDRYDQLLKSGKISINERQSATLINREAVADMAKAVSWVDSFGNEIKTPIKIVGNTPDAPPTSSALDATAPANVDVVPNGTWGAKEQKVKPGQYVFWAYKDNPDLPGTKRRVMMLKTDVINMAPDVTPAYIAQAQIALNNPVTGIPDEELLGLWDKAATLSARFAAKGTDVSVLDLFDSSIRAKAEDNAKKARGGGGGSAGAPKAVISDSYAKAALSAGMLKTAGREPTDAEVAAFRAQLQGAWDSGAQPDPAQMAVDWTRSSLPAESSSDAASTYMNAIMGLMGAKTGGG